MNRPLARGRWLALLPVVAALAFTDSASAHAILSPSTVLARSSQVFTLAVPTEKEGATTTQIELTPPKGFGIDSFGAAPGWKRTTDQSGSGEEVEIRKVAETSDFPVDAVSEEHLRKEQEWREANQRPITN